MSDTSPKLGLGLDFGTSNSAVAIFDGTEITLATFPTPSSQENHLPTALYVSNKHEEKIGYEALDSYIADNAGRIVKLTEEHIGDFQLTVNAGGDAHTATVSAHAFTDQDMPSRLFRGLKRWLAFPRLKEIDVFGRHSTLVDLIVPMLHYMKTGADRILPEKPSHLHCGRPVLFEGADEEMNKIGMARLTQGCNRAGFPETHFLPEPIAATLSFMRHTPLEIGQHCLCFDFGGGTLDLCIIKRTPSGFEVITTHGVDLGGDELDQRIYKKKVFPEIGSGTEIKLGIRRIPFPFHDVELGLLNWQLSHQLNKPHIRERILQGIKQGGPDAIKFKRLRELVRRNMSYLVFRAIERAKVDLSEKTETTIDIPQLDLQIPFTRTELDQILSSAVSEVEDSVHETLEKAEMKPEDLARIFCTGGSSKILCVKEKLDSIFPGKVTEHDHFTSIAAGLAIANYHGITQDSITF